MEQTVIVVIQSFLTLGINQKCDKCIQPTAFHTEINETAAIYKPTVALKCLLLMSWRNLYIGKQGLENIFFLLTSTVTKLADSNEAPLLIEDSCLFL